MWKNDTCENSSILNNNCENDYFTKGDILVDNKKQMLFIHII